MHLWIIFLFICLLVARPTFTSCLFFLLSEGGHGVVTVWHKCYGSYSICLFFWNGLFFSLCCICGLAFFFFSPGPPCHWVTETETKTMMTSTPSTMATILSRRASRPSLLAPSMSPAWRLFLDMMEYTSATMLTGQMGQKQDRMTRMR